VRARAWLEWNERSLLGKGRLALLEFIAQQGSISGAARAMGVSYRAAWRWVEQMNRAAARPLVVTSTGGRGGGGARLTPLGRFLLDATRHLEDRLNRFCEGLSLELVQALREVQENETAGDPGGHGPDGRDPGSSAPSRHGPP